MITRQDLYATAGQMPRRNRGPNRVARAHRVGVRRGQDVEPLVGRFLLFRRLLHCEEMPGALRPALGGHLPHVLRLDRSPRLRRDEERRAGHPGGACSPAPDRRPAAERGPASLARGAHAHQQDAGPLPFPVEQRGLVLLAGEVPRRVAARDRPATRLVERGQRRRLFALGNQDNQEGCGVRFGCRGNDLGLEGHGGPIWGWQKLMELPAIGYRLSVRLSACRKADSW